MSGRNKTKKTYLKNSRVRCPVCSCIFSYKTGDLLVDGDLVDFSHRRNYRTCRNDRIPNLEKQKHMVRGSR